MRRPFALVILALAVPLVQGALQFEGGVDTDLSEGALLQDIYGHPAGVLMDIDQDGKDELVTETDRSIAAIETGGAELWRRGPFLASLRIGWQAGPDAPQGAFVSEAGIIAVQTGESRIEGLDAKDGKTQWSHEVDGHVQTAHAIAGHGAAPPGLLLLVGREDDASGFASTSFDLLRLDGTGGIVWNLTMPPEAGDALVPGITGGTILDRGEQALWTVRGGTGYWIDLTTGRTRASFQADCTVPRGPARSDGGGYLLPCLYDSGLRVYDGNGGIVADYQPEPDAQNILDVAFLDADADGHQDALVLGSPCYLATYPHVGDQQSDLKILATDEGCARIHVFEGPPTRLGVGALVLDPSGTTLFDAAKDPPYFLFSFRGCTPAQVDDDPEMELLGYSQGHNNPFVSYLYGADVETSRQQDAGHDDDAIGPSRSPQDGVSWSLFYVTTGGLAALTLLMVVLLLVTSSKLRRMKESMQQPGRTRRRGPRR